MDLAEVVVHGEQGECMLMVLGLLAVSVGKPGEAPVAHPDR